MAEAIETRSKAPRMDRPAPPPAMDPEGRYVAFVHWGPSFAGAIASLALSALGMALWWAIAYGSGVSFVGTNMPWFFLGTVLAALLAGGVIAGGVAAVRDRTVGLLDGMTVWALTLIGALIPLSLRGLTLANSGVAHPARSTALQVSSGNAWALFGAIAGGLLCALIGAAAGRSLRLFPLRQMRAPTKEGRSAVGDFGPVRRAS